MCWLGETQRPESLSEPGGRPCENLRPAAWRQRPAPRDQSSRDRPFAVRRTPGSFEFQVRGLPSRPRPGSYRPQVSLGGRRPLFVSSCSVNRNDQVNLVAEAAGSWPARAQSARRRMNSSVCSPLHAVILMFVCAAVFLRGSATLAAGAVSHAVPSLSSLTTGQIDDAATATTPAASPPARSTNDSKSAAGAATDRVPAVGSDAGPARAAGPVTADGLPPARYTHLIDSSGRLVRVRADATVQRFLEFLEQNLTKPAEESPAFGITGVEITGIADEDRAILDVRIGIQLNRPEAEVVLGLPEGRLEDKTYRGSGRETFLGFDEKQGLRWHLAGQTQHELTLRIRVPVRKEPPIRRLRLTIPSAPRSNLVLNVPEADVAVRAADALTIVTRPGETGGTVLEQTGLGTRLDLAWQPVTRDQQTESVLEVETAITARIGLQSALIEAEQQIVARQGTFQELTIRLPPGAESRSLDGTGIRRFQPHPSQPDTFNVLLNAPSSGRVTLNWAVRVPMPAQRRTTLEGFQVEGARSQMGTLRLIPVEGLRLEPAGGQDASLIRMNVAEVRGGTNLGNATHAYRFYAQPFRLTLTASTVEPFFVVQPHVIVAADRQELILNGRFSVDVFRGDLERVQIRWPEWRADGWSIEQVGPREGVVDSFVIRDDAIETRLSDARKPRFTVELRARRPIKPNEEPRLTVPQLVSGTLTPTFLTVINSESVETETTPLEETVMRLSSEQGGRQPELPETYAGRPRQDFRLMSAQQKLALRVVPQTQRIRTEVETRLSGATSRWEIETLGLYDVRFEPLTACRWLVPENQQGACRFELRTNPEADANTWIDLPVKWTDGDQPGWLTARIELPRPLLGRFQIRCRLQGGLAVQTTGEAAALNWDGPKPLDGSLDRSRLVARSSEWWQVELSDPSWRSENISEAEWSWVRSGGPVPVTLQLQAMTPEGDIAWRVQKGLLIFESDGTGRTRAVAEFQLTGNARFLGWEYAPECEHVSAQWNGVDLLPQTMTRPQGKMLARLSAEQRQSTESLLRLEYRIDGTTASRWWVGHQLMAPQLDSVQLVGPLLVDWRLPAQQHLWQFDRGLTPLYRWNRLGLFWFRTSPLDSAQVESWVRGPADKRSEIRPLAPSNRYLFETFNLQARWHCESLSGAVIVLIGAGLALLVGFLLLRIRRLRHILTLMSFATAIAFLGLWFRSQIEVVLQPFLIGLLFPLMATIWESRRLPASEAADSLVPLHSTADLPPVTPDNWGRGASSANLRMDRSTALHAPDNPLGRAVSLDSGSGIS